MRRGADPLQKFRPAGPPAWGAEWLAPEPVRLLLPLWPPRRVPEPQTQCCVRFQVMHTGLDRSLVPKPEHVENPDKMLVTQHPTRLLIPESDGVVTSVLGRDLAMFSLADRFSL